MSRYFSKVTIPYLAQAILTAFKDKDEHRYNDWQEDYGKNDDPIKAIKNSCGCGIPWRDLTQQIAEDMEKCSFDLENVECEEGYIDNAGKIVGFHTLSNGLTFLGITAGGDWERPIFYIVYCDGNDLRAYIPTEGNPWNTDTKSAYGNEESDNENAKKRFGVDSYEEVRADVNLILKSIEDRLKITDSTVRSAKFKLTEDLRTRVGFSRGSCLKDGVASWPWHWSIIIQDGHPYHISDSFDTFEKCFKDFSRDGKDRLDEIQKRLKKWDLVEK